MSERAQSGSNRAAGTAPLDAAALVGLLFFVSGAASLLLESAAMRAFLELFGSAAASLGAVGGAFLVCLALGAWLIGTRVDRARRTLLWYAALEAVACVGGLLALWIWKSLDPIADSFARAEVAGDGRMMGRLAVCVGLLLVPVGALGATLPLLARLRAATRPRGIAAGGLQAASTLGAMSGALLASLVLLGSLGMTATWLIAATLNGVVALAAFALARMVGDDAPAAPAEEPRLQPASAAPPAALELPVATLLVASAVSGFCVLGLEVLLFRGLGQVTRGGQDTLGVLLAAWLGASALGTAFGTWWSRKRAAEGWLLGQLAALVAPFLALLCLRAMSHAQVLGFWRFGESAITWDGRLVQEVLGALLVAGPSAFATAIAFPCACELLPRGGARFGRHVALLSGAWAAGAALAGIAVPGALLTAFGLKTLLVALAVASLLVIAPVAAERGGALLRGKLAWVGGAAALAALLYFAPLTGRWSLDEPLIFVERVRGPGNNWVIKYVEDPAANVAVVVHSDGRKVLAVNNQLALGGSGSSHVERMQGFLPALLHPNPVRALALGVGAGLCVAALRDAGCQHTDAVELLPAVVSALPLFAVENRQIGTDPRVRIHEGDARAFVRAAAPESYELIVGDLFFPWEAGTGQLYTKEHFERVKRLLTPDGIFCQWLPGHQLSWEEIGAIGRTFCEVFDGATLWIARPELALPVLALVAGRERLEIDPVALDERLKIHPLRVELDRLGIADVRDFLALYVADEWFFREKFEQSGIVTADRPTVEYDASRRVETDEVVALHNRRRLFEMKEDIVSRMTQSAIDKKRLGELKRELSLASRSMWQLYEAETNLALAEANRSLPPDARKNLPEDLEREAFQLAGGLLRARPDYQPAEAMVIKLLMHQLRVGNFDFAAQAARALELEPTIGPRARLANLRGMAFLLAWCDDSDQVKQDQRAKALAYACSDLRRATELDRKLVEAQVNLGIALFLAGSKEQFDEARAVLAIAREQILAPDREGGHGLPPSAEAVFAYLNGSGEEAKGWLARSVGQPWCSKIAMRMQKGPDTP